MKEANQLSRPARHLRHILRGYCQASLRTRGQPIAFPSQKTLAARLDYTPRHIRRLLRELLDAGIVVSVRGYRGANTYRMTGPAEVAAGSPSPQPASPAPLIDPLRTMPYGEYLQSAEWQARRVEHLRVCGYRCQVCNAADLMLDVHHRTYERRGAESFADLIVLCRECHDLFHGAGKLKS
jgi:hypothetical protein